MDRRLISLCSDGSGDVLEATLDKLEEDQLKKFLSDAIRTSATDPVQLMKAVFFGSPVGKLTGLKRRRLLFQHVLECINSDSRSDKVCGDVVGVLMLEVDSFGVEELAELCEYFLGKIKAGEVATARCLELFPKVLSSVQWMSNVPVPGDGDGGTLSGVAYKPHMINKICSCKWSSGIVIHLTNMFRDVNMTSDELRFVLEKVVRMFDSIELAELPPLIYQLLLLTNKGHKRLVLDGLCAFFCKLDRQCAEEQQAGGGDDEALQPAMSADLRPTQGTVILHITFAAKQDQELGREFIKTLKSCQQRSSSSVLSPFVLGLALSLARIRRFEEPVFEILTTAITRSYRDAERRKGSRWAYETTPAVSNIAALLMEVCQLSGWDHVTQGLVQLGFMLMDANAPKSAGFTVQTPQQQACSLGSGIVLETFKTHDAVRADILQQILNRVVVKATSSVAHYLDLLTSAASHSPQTLLISLPKIREAFDYLSYLPLSSAIGLLRSVQPLMKLSTTLKDSLILVLRKALFSREVESRKVGLAGFLLLLRKLKVTGGCVPCSQASQPWSASQIQVEIHSQVRPSGYEALCLDILGNIRRCMTQQFSIRQMMYEGLYQVLVANPELRTSVLDLLRRQLQLYFIADTAQAAPILLDACFSMSNDTAVASEPLGHLLLAVQSCLQRCLRWQDSVDEDSITADERAVIDTTEKIVSSLVKRLQDCELEDLDLDKSADFSVATSVGAKNHLCAGIVLDVYEAAIEFVFLDGGFSAESGQAVCKLFAVHESLTSVLEKASAGVKRGRTGAAKSTQRQSLFSLSFLAQFWKALYSDQLPSHQDCLLLLRANTALIRHLLTVTLQYLQQLHSNGHSLLADGKCQENDLRQCATIAKILLSQFVKAVAMGTTGDASGADLSAANKDKGKSMPSLSLDCVCVAMQVMSALSSERLWLFLDQLESAYDIEDSRPSSDADLVAHVSYHLRQLQTFIISLLSANHEDLGNRDCQTLLQIVQLLSMRLPPDSQEFADLYAWVVRVNTERNINDAGLVKSFVQLLLKLTDACKTSLNVVRRLSRDIHYHLGDVEEDVELEEQSVTFAAINPRTAAPTVLAVVCSHLEAVLDGVNWVIGKAKMSYASPEGVDDGEEQCDRILVENIELPVCQRLVSAVSAANDIVQSAIPSGLSREHILKMCKNLYTTLGAWAKFQLSLYAKQQGNISGAFQKLVTLTGVHLAQEVYSFITYIQLPDNDAVNNGGQVTAKKGKKGGKLDKKTAANGKAVPAHVAREQRAIPALIFAIEQYERFLIQLSKKSKVNLMADFKRSTARDFRINGAVLEAALREQESEDEEDMDDEELLPADDDSCCPAAKKAKGGGGGKGLSKKLARRVVHHKEIGYASGNEMCEEDELELLEAEDGGLVE